MSQITNVMKMHTKDHVTLFFVPWLILFISFTVNLIIGFLTGGESPLYTGGLSSIYIAMLISGIIVLAQMHPFAIGLSVRRTDFFLGTTGMIVAVSAGIAIVLLLLSLVEQWTGAWGVNLHFFHLPYLSDGSAIEQLLIHFILLLNMCFLGFTISSVYQRFGRNGMYYFFGTIGLIVTIGVYLCSYYKWWLDVFHWFSNHTAFQLALWTVPLAVIFLLVSYLFLRKATV
ncbi:MAG TPA: hypothetical protein VFT51_14710 [Bacillales bacterium]|nr:hypothetical protein [Bacillales bacterium]